MTSPIERVRRVTSLWRRKVLPVVTCPTGTEGDRVRSKTDSDVWFENYLTRNTCVVSRSGSLSTVTPKNPKLPLLPDPGSITLSLTFFYRMTGELYNMVNWVDVFTDNSRMKQGTVLTNDGQTLYIHPLYNYYSLFHSGIHNFMVSEVKWFVDDSRFVTWISRYQSTQVSSWD